MRRLSVWLLGMCLSLLCVLPASALPYELVEDRLVLRPDVSRLIEQLAISSDYVVQVKDGIAEIWNRQSKLREHALDLTTGKGSIHCQVTLSGSRMLSVCPHESVLRFWDLAGGRMLKEIRLTPDLYPDLAFVSNNTPWIQLHGSSMALFRQSSTQNPSTLEIWTADGPKQLASIPLFEQPDDFVFNERYLVLGFNREQGVVEWNSYSLPSGQLLRRWSNAWPGWLEGMALDGGELWANLKPLGEGNILSSWDLKQGRLLWRSPESHQGMGQIFPKARAIKRFVVDLPVNVSEPAGSYLRWPDRDKSFERWEPTLAERRTLLDQEFVINDKSGSFEWINEQGLTEPFVPAVSKKFVDNSQWWFYKGSLYIYQASPEHRIERVTSQGKHEVLLELGENEAFWWREGHFVYLRDREKGFRRLEIESGRIEPWLKGYDVEESRSRGEGDADFVIGSWLVQVGSRQGSSLGGTQVKIWDLKQGTLHQTYISPDLVNQISTLSNIFPYFGLYTSDSDGRSYLKIWDIKTTESVVSRRINPDGLSCQDAWPDGPELQKLIVKNIEKNTYQVSLCDIRKGIALKNWIFRDQESSIIQAFIQGESLYLLDIQGKVQIRDIQSGTLKETNTSIVDFLSRKGHGFEEAWKHRDYLYILSLGPNQPDRTRFLFSEGWFSLVTHHLLPMYDSDALVYQDAREFWFSDGLGLFRLPAGETERAQKQTLLQIKAFPDALFIHDIEGNYLGFGPYQKYLHLAREGYIYPWLEAEARWHRPEKVLQSIRSLSQKSETQPQVQGN